MNKNRKAIRQVIHNEIGITKEEIRAGFKQIMEEQLQKAINIMVSEQLVERAVSYNVGRFMVGHKYSSDVILNAVKNEVKTQVAEKIMKSLNISVESISTPESKEYWCGTCEQNVDRGCGDSACQYRYKLPPAPMNEVNKPEGE